MSDKPAANTGPNAEAAPGAKASGTNTNEVSLTDIDSLLAAEDPEFAQGLQNIREVGPEGSVEIESAVADMDDAGDEGAAASGPAWWSRIPILRALVKFLSPKLDKVRPWIFQRWLLARARVLGAGRDLMGWLRYRPVAILQSGRDRVRYWQNRLAKLWHRYQGLPRSRQLAVVAFFLAVVGASGLLAMNLKGQWIPFLEEPPLMSFLDVADGAEAIEAGVEFDSFLKAFPQEKFGYLFKSVVVNLKRLRASQNPMGYFEFYVELDSQDSAVEAQQREKELLDLMQRTIEELSYQEVQGPVGRQRLKDLLRQTLNEALNHGWAKEVFIKNVVLKP